jgi:hypothetical protein
MPAPGFVSDADLKNFFAGCLKKDPAELPNTVWDPLIRQANRSAYWEIVTKLGARGFSQAQADQWDRGLEFQNAIGAWWAFQLGGGLEGADDKFIAKLDRRKELEAIPITIGGVIAAPVENFMPINFGVVDTDQDLFVIDPDDPRTGEPTQW